VLDYVGPGHWCFVAEVCSLWKQLYVRVASREVRVTDFGRKITCVPQMTVFSVVFSSLSTVRLARAHGLNFRFPEYQRAAGMHADVAALAVAHESGIRYTASVMDGAVRHNQLDVVQFLRAQGCPLDKFVFDAAATRGDTAMCAYLHAEHCPWSAATCHTAAINCHLGTLS
jgi:hypothetical protein